MGFKEGDSVRIRGSTPVYRVLAVNNSMVTILLASPQPNGEYLTFSPTALQTVDESRLELAADVQSI
ncbi:hypothetical protein VTJ04DRAFT_4270 [Mycothermus thermophilus]|uniref:uncharacterized protein n=1 Tax=Humicola insolens TaxID=85995 RepID=UPI003743B68A